MEDSLGRGGEPTTFDALAAARDSRRLGATLLTLIAVAGSLAAVEVWYASRVGSTGLWILAAATGAFTLALVPPWRLTQQGRNDLAVFATCIAIFAIQVSYLVVYPTAYPAITIASVVIVALALPFVQGNRLFALVILSWVVAIASVLVGVFAPPSFAIPGVAGDIIIVGSGLAAVTVGMVLMWQFARDMTEALGQEREARENLQAAHQALHEQERMKTRFINAAAHELNTPMTPVLLQLHLLRSGRHAVHDPDQERMVRVLERNLERMKDLVHEMLDVARLESGRLPLRPEVFDVADALQAAVDDFRLVAKSRNVDLRLSVPGPLPVDTDRRRTEQVISNLVSNAVRLTPAGGTVTVSASPEPDGTILRVEDTGVGLDAAQLTALFQPFTRVHDETSQGAGSGLGLFICHGIARELGGRLWAESPGPDRGATFSLLLPPRPPAASPVRAPGTPRAAASP